MRNQNPKNEARSRFTARAILFVLVAALAVAGGRQLRDANAAGEKEVEEDTMVFKKIGVIHSPYTQEKGAPRQGGLAPDVESTIVVDAEYAEALQDIETFTHVIVLYAFDRSRGWSPLVQPPGEKRRHGVFATRSPRRPNPIGMTVVKLVKREGATLHVKGLDAFEGTPLLDLKPYVPKFDRIEDAGGGWRVEKKEEK